MGQGTVVRVGPAGWCWMGAGEFSSACGSGLWLKCLQTIQLPTNLLQVGSAVIL